MKIEIVGNARPWVDGKPRAAGWVGDVTDGVAEKIIANGHAMVIEAAPSEIKAPRKKRARA